MFLSVLGARILCFLTATLPESEGKAVGFAVNHLGFGYEEHRCCQVWRHMPIIPILKELSVESATFSLR